MSHRTISLLLLLAGVAIGCGGGRDFKPSAPITEWRPSRPVTSGAAADEGDLRTTPPGRIAAKVKPLSLPTEVRLSNGIRVVMLERHDFPSISAVLVLDRGAAAAAPGVAALYSEAMTGSSSEYKSSEAWQYLGFVGGSVGNETRRDGISLQVTALSPLFVAALSRAAPMFTSPALDGDDIDDARTHLIAENATKNEDASDVATDTLWATVFPKPHPYGVPVSGEMAVLGGRRKGAPEEKVTDASVKSFRASNLFADHVGVAVVGDFKPASMQKILENALGKLPKQPATAAATPVQAIPPGPGGTVIVIDRPGAGQSSVAIGWPGPRAADPELVTLDVLAGATAGDLSTRLNITVRKELGASYGVHMSALGLRDAGLVRISAAIDTARTIDALRGLLKELERLRNEPLTAQELAVAKLRTYADLERGSTRGLARYLGYAITEGLPPAHVVMHNARVDTVTAEGVRAAAEKYLAQSEARVVIVGDAARIVPGLRTLGLGNVTVVPAAK